MRGVMLGLLVGDCVGAPVEGMPGWEIQKRYGRVTTLLDPFEVWTRRPNRGRLRGLHTDDTQQAWILADLLAREGTLTPKSVAARYVSFARPRDGLPGGVFRGTGKFFRETVRSLVAGIPPLEAGQPTAGNGAAMRIAPVGAFLARRLDAVVPMALSVSSVTHRDPRALEAAAALAHVVACLLADGPPSTVGACVDAAMEGARLAEIELAAGRPIRLTLAEATHSGEFRRILGSVRLMISESFDVVVPRIGRLAGEIETTRRVRGGTDGFAPASVAAAIVVGCGAASYREAVECVVNFGEDTDTTAAMTGAIVGARLGSGDIPREWLDSILARTSLETVSTALAGTPADLPDHERLEEEWSRQEQAEAARRQEESG
jgi:ADP-ribosylglycohydrolase